MKETLSFSDEIVNLVYNKTDGYCRYCNKKINFRNYGNPDTVGAWEIDHWTPVSRGGSDDIENLVLACIDCNRSKQEMTGLEFLRWLRGLEYI